MYGDTIRDITPVLTHFRPPVLSLSSVTGIVSAIEQGYCRAADRLLRLAYDELRKLAAQRIRQEKPVHTLQATVLVHEA